MEKYSFTFIRKSLLLLISLIFIISANITAQTGPGGVGNSGGTSGQPRNILWLDASTLGFADGADLTTWDDLSGNSNNLTQGTASFTPIFQDDGSNINGHPRAEFSKDNNRIIINPFNDMPTSGITTIMVYKTSGTGDGMLSYANTTNDNAFLLLNNSNLRTYVSNDGSYHYDDSGDAFNSGNWQIMSHKWKSSGGNIIINQDGDQVHTATLENGTSIAAGGCFGIGGEQDGVNSGWSGSQDFVGEMAEVVMFNSSINKAQRLLVENYLSQKYALAFTTASNDHYGNDGDYNSSYIYNIAGIGQESDGDHTQTVSGGLYLYEWNSSLANTEYAMLGHDNTVNSSATVRTDAEITTCGAEAAWARDWYIEKTSSDGVDIKLIFDFKEGLTDGQYPANVANYVLLYRAATSGNYSVVTTAGQGTFDADQVYFNISDANLSNGYYTIGTNDQTNSPVEGVAGRTWYALTSGDWDTWDYWTLDPSGSLPNNPSNETPAAIDKVVIHTGKTITISADTKSVASITVDGILQLGTTSGHNFTTINGSGRIRLSSDNFPAGDATHFTTAGQGEGAVVWQGGSYNLSTAHTFFKMEVDLDNSANTLTMLADYTLNGELVVETGILQINDNSSTTNLNIEIQGDITIESTGQIMTGTGNARHQFDLYGNLTNGGTIEFTNRTLPLVAGYYTAEASNGIVDANFLNDTENQSVLCNGITNFYRIEIDKGTDMTYELAIEASSTANFKLFGYANEAHASTTQLVTNTNALGLIKGTVRIKANVEIPNLSSNGNYNISEAAKLWVDGGTVSTTISNSIVTYGTAKVSSGTFEALVANGFTLRDNGEIIVEGGILNTNQIKTSTMGSGQVGSYVQTGGTANIYGTNSNSDYYVFNLTFTDNVFLMTGGTLHIHEAHGKGGIFINSDPANHNVTGGTVICDIDDSEDFIITSRAPFWNVILRNTTAGVDEHILDEGVDVGSTDEDLAAQPLLVLNDLTIESDAVFKPNSIDVNVGRNLTIEEDGIYDEQYNTNVSSHTLTFDGTEAGVIDLQNITETGGQPAGAHQRFYNIVIDKPQGIRLTMNANASKSTTSWSNNLIQVTNDFQLLNGTLNQADYSLRMDGTITVQDTLGVYYTSNIDAQIKIASSQATTINTTENAVIGNFRVNSYGQTITFTSDIYIKRIHFVAGRIYMGTNELKVDAFRYSPWEAQATGCPDCASDADGRGCFSEDDMVIFDGNASDGGLSLYIPSDGLKTESDLLDLPDGTNIDIANDEFLFPIGIGTDGCAGSAKYTPAIVKISTSTDDGYITITPADAELKTTDLTGGDLLDYYWKVDYEDFTTEPTIQYKFYYNDNDIVGAESGYYPGKVLDIEPFTRSYENDLTKVDEANNLITFNGSGSGFTLEKANYTAGVAGRFVGAPTVYYSRAVNGVWWEWQVTNHWSTDATNKHIGAPAGSYPGVGDVVVVGSDYVNDLTTGPYSKTGEGRHQIRIDGSVGDVDVAQIIFDSEAGATALDVTAMSRVYVRQTITLDASRISGKGEMVQDVGPVAGNFGTINADLGDFVADPDNGWFFWLKGAAGTTTISDRFEFPNMRPFGGGSAGTRFITFSDDIEATSIVIDNYVTLLVENNITCAGEFLMGSNREGYVIFSDIGTNNTLECGSLNMAGGDDLNGITVENSGSDLHILKINSDITLSNATNFDLTSASGGNVILELTSTGDHTFTNTTAITPDLYRIVLNKGTDQTSTFTFNDDFDLNGATSGIGVEKALELQNGTLILNDAGIDIDLTTGDDDFEIPAEACLEVRQGEVNVSGDDSGIFLDGKLLVSGGTVDMDDGANNGNNYLEYSASGNAEIEVSAGTLTVGSQIRRGLGSSSGALSYTQTGGDVIVGKNSAPEGNRGVFEVLNSGSVFTHSTGSLTIVRQQTSPTIAALYLDPATSTLTAGSTITFGNGDTPVGQEFGIYSAINLQNLTLDNTSTNNPSVLMWTVPLSINGELLIQSGTEFKANGLNLNLYGDLTNSGTFTANLNTTYFKGTSDQEIDGNTTFYNFTNQNTANLNLATGNADITVDNVLNLENGILNDNSNDISVYGDINNDATHVYGGAGDGISMLGTSQQVMTGDGTYGKLTINNGNGVTLPVGNAPTVKDYLKMESGIFNIGGNLLTLEIDCIIQEANPFGETNMIQTNISFTDNGVKKYYPSGAGSFTYPMGSGGKFTPITTTLTQNTSSIGYLIAKPADEIHPSIQDDLETPDPEITDENNVLQYYWTVTSDNITDISGTLEFTYDPSDVMNESSNYDVTDYITAKLLNDGSGNWYKYDDVSKFDETNEKLIFDLTDAADEDITGDYTAGVDGSSFNGAIPDQVPLYVSNGTGGGDWHTESTWTVYDNSTSSWVLPSVIGFPTIPRGARVRILAGDEVQTLANYISAYTTDILGTLDVNTTFGNRVGNVTGTGTLYTERGSLPAGYYETFFSSSGGTIEYGGSTDYSVLSNITQVNNLTFSGTGDRELPNLDLTLFGDLLFSDAGSGSPDVINEFDKKIIVSGDVSYNAGTFDAGTGADAIFEFAGTISQTISGNSTFTGTNAFNHVTMNNTNGVTLQKPVDIDNNLVFTLGVINTTSTNILTLENTGESIVTGAGNGRYIDGPLSKNILVGGDFNFPIGNIARYGYLILENVSHSDYWQAEYFNYNPNNDGYNPDNFEDPPLKSVSGNEYWSINGPTGSSSYVELRWDASSGVSSDASERDYLRVTEWISGNNRWEAAHSTNTASGTSSAGTVTTDPTAPTLNGDHFFTISSTLTAPTPVWTGTVSTSWNTTSNWSTSTVPTGGSNVTIPDVSGASGNFPVIGSGVDCNDLTINASAKLTIDAGNWLTLNGDLINNGSLYVSSPTGDSPSASFIDNGTISGSGKIYMDRYMSNMKFHYVSSPIQAGGNAASDLFTRSNGSGNYNGNFYYYNEAYDIDTNSATAPGGAFDSDNLVIGWTYAHNGEGGADVDMAVKQGYAFYTDIGQTVTFIGTPNTGDMTISGLTHTANDPTGGPLPDYYDGWNLVANPYPSAIDWDLIRGSLTNLDDAIYVWDGDQYSSYVAGVSGGKGTLSNEVPPMQAFFVRANADGAGFTLNNSHRVHSSDDYKSNKAPISNLVKMKLEANGREESAVVYFKSNATIEFDGVYDAFKLFPSSPNAQLPHLFTLTSGEKNPLTINALPEKLIGETTIPIGIQLGTSGDYTINFTEFNFDNSNVYFIDKLENTSTYINNSNSYTFNFTGGDVRDRFELRFKSNNPPKYADGLANQTTNEDEGFSYTYANDIFTEFDEGDRIVSYSVDGGAEKSLPAWLNYNSVTRTFTGTPENSDVGEYTIRITATDIPGESSSYEFQIQVNNVNDAPTLENSVSDLTATENVEFVSSFVSETFNDIDPGDVLNYTAKLADGSPLPAWLQLNSETRTFSGTPDNIDVGTLSIELTASDIAGENVSCLFDLQVVNVNDAPTLANSFADMTATEDTNFTNSFSNQTFTDVDQGDIISYTARLSDGSDLPKWLRFNSDTREFYGTPENNDVGIYNIELIANDIALESVSYIFNIIVNNVNDAPTLANSFADMTATEDINFSNSFSNLTFTDVDQGDILSYTARQSDGSNLPNWLSFDADRREFYGTPENADVGTYNIELTANDIAQEKVSYFFNIVVNNVNDVPVINASLEDKTINSGELFEYQIPDNIFTDVDKGDVLTLSASNLPDWLTFNTFTGLFEGTATYADKGLTNIVLTATDLFGEEVYDDFDLTVISANDFEEDITLYPNPSKGKLRINIESLVIDEKVEVLVTDAVGNFVFKKTYKENNFEIDISKESSGIYFVIVRTGTQILRKVIVKQ